MARVRLDVLLTQRGFCESREQAQRLILEGKVRVEGVSTILKPATLVPQDATLILLESPKYVSRGGEKLEWALRVFNITPSGLVFADIGASTGGFTDCLLQHGAKKVFAIDVGYGQLHEKLRSLPQVVVLEKLNARYLTPAHLGERVDGVTVDVSFISLRLLWTAIVSVLKDQGVVIALVKPQFEAGRTRVRKGVVRDPEVHKQVLEMVLDAAEEKGLSLRNLTFSPLLGPKGNIEFFAHLQKGGVSLTRVERSSIILKVVQDAHEFFGV
ncbi:TlyA family RNA methyltransferase [Candidatus Caldatribacterium sp.]|uniref:TlyA family RNA methyltransferase n=1 Tax=Candidatus Caldatribacterium sp. TaxID=2282143 RepID=UPI0038405A7D|nr:TlyA family RNA methyltransferase [Candidatus Caldatribacterium sp.]